jgi:hypothetical protein
MRLQTPNNVTKPRRNDKTGRGPPLVCVAPLKPLLQARSHDTAVTTSATPSSAASQGLELAMCLGPLDLEQPTAASYIDMCSGT